MSISTTSRSSPSSAAPAPPAASGLSACMPRHARAWRRAAPADDWGGGAAADAQHAAAPHAAAAAAAAPAEGVLAAAALRALGGEFQGRLYFENDAQRERAVSMGVASPDAKLTRDEIVRGDCIFAATGVTSGKLLRGARRREGTVALHSFIADSKTGSRRFLDTTIRLDEL